MNTNTNTTFAEAESVMRIALKPLSEVEDGFETALAIRRLIESIAILSKREVNEAISLLEILENVLWDLRGPDIEDLLFYRNAVEQERHDTAITAEME